MATQKKASTRTSKKVASKTPKGDARSTVESTVEERYADAVSVFVEPSVEIGESQRFKLARTVRDMKVGHGDTCRLLDTETVAPGADRALITVCHGPEGSGLLVQRDVVVHPYLEGKDDWVAVRLTRFPDVRSAFVAMNEIRGAVGQVLKSTRSAEAEPVDADDAWADLGV